LREHGEVERRLILNLDEIRTHIGSLTPEESESRLAQEVGEALQQVSPDRSPSAHTSIVDTSRWLAEREIIRGGARRAIEVEFEIQSQRKKAQFQRVSILGIDEEGWRKANDFPAAYTLVFVLDRIPHPIWARVFGDLFQQDFYLMKRRTDLHRDRIVMVVADSDNMPHHADFAKRLVAETNQFIEGAYFRQIDEHFDREKRRALQEFDTIQSLKARVKGIRL
jgi:hypothetical protein